MSNDATMSNDVTISTGAGSAFEEIALTLHVLKTPDASNTVTDTYMKQ
jgi:hypothetical protein